MLSKHKLKG